MAARFKVTVDKPRWLKMIREKQRAVAGPAVGALVQVANDAVAEGRQQIASSGRFSDNLRRTIRAQDTWQSGLKARMRDAKEGGEPSLQAKALVFHTIGLAGIFEHGATIEGKPMLWIPTDPRAPPASRSGKKLTSATINGTPVLFDARDPDRHRKPLYIGVPSIRIPKKWRIIEIVKKHAGQIGMEFLKRFKGD
jgi:hypothetical protein